MPLDLLYSMIGPVRRVLDLSAKRRHRYLTVEPLAEAALAGTRLEHILDPRVPAGQFAHIVGNLWF